MSVSREVVGGNSPVWAGPSLCGLGLAAWIGAGAMAHADDLEPSPAVVPSQVEGLGAEDVVAADRQRDEEREQDVVIIEDEDPPAQAPSAPVEAAEPCAPSIEHTFANGESDLDRADDLAAMARAAATFADHKLVIEGYASAEGSERANLELSHRRAQRAKAELVELGVEESRITVQAFGEYRPNMAGDETRDRRVIVRVEGLATCPDEDAEE